MRLLFPALFDKPPGISLADLETDEHLELFIRQHFITNVGWIVTSLLLLILPPIFINPLLSLVQLIKPPLSVAIALSVLWYALVLAYILERFLYWYFNVYIVTNQHLIDLDFENLLRRNKEEVRLDDVQSVMAQMAGVIGPLFNFGTVIISTAADRKDLKFVNIPRPDLVQQRIEDLQGHLAGGGGADAS